MDIRPGCDGCKSLKVITQQHDGYRLYWCQHPQALARMSVGILIDPWDVRPAWCPSQGKFGLLVKCLRKQQDDFLKTVQ